MERRVIAILFSDLHLGLWSKFNEGHSRTKQAFRLLKKVFKECKEHKCYPLFGGDFFHKPEYVETELMGYLIQFVGDNSIKRPILGISGNHDMNKTNQVNKLSPSLWHNISQAWPSMFKDISLSSEEFFPGFRVYGIPYLDHNIGLNEYVQKINLNPKEKNILLLHTDYPGAEDTNGIEVGSVENLNTNLLSKFDLTLIGHIHKPQRLGRKVYIIGAPFQQRRTDRSAKLGYWRLYNTLEMEFVSLDNFPKFIDVESSDMIKDDGNYYTVIGGLKKPEEESREISVSVGMSKKKMVSRYLKAINDRDPEKKKVLLDILNEVEV